MMRLLTSTFVLFLTLFSAELRTLQAQELDEAALKERFQRQMELFKSAQLGKSRGLVLQNSAPAPEAIPLKIEEPNTVKVEAIPPKATVSEVAEPATPTKTAPATETVTTVSATVPADDPKTYWKLPDADQINFRVNFAFDSSAIAPKQKPELRKLCAVINEMNIKLVRIIGHTDGTGSAAYNQNLSTLRAREVAHFFEDDCHIARERLEAVGVGKQFLLNPSNPKADENRRVEFQAAS